MQSLKNITIIFLSFILLMGCAGTYKPITDYALENYQTVTIVSNIPQQAIRLQIVPSNTSGLSNLHLGPVGGMPGYGSPRDMGANVRRARTAERRVRKFQLAIGDDDTSQKFNRDLNAQIQHLPWAQVIEMRHTNASAEELYKLLLKGNYESDVMILINTDYSFDPHFQTIEFTADYSIYTIDKNGKVQTKAQKRAHEQKEPKAFHSNQVIYQGHIYPAAGSERRLTEHEIKAAASEINKRFESKVAQETNLPILNKLKNEKAAELRYLKRKRTSEGVENLGGAIWLDNNSELAKQAMIEGRKEIVKLIVMELSGDANSLEGLEVISRDGYEMYLVSKDELSGREIYRLREGLLPGKLLSKTSEHDYLKKMGRQ